MMPLSALASTSRELVAIRSRKEKIGCIADLLQQCHPDEIGSAALWLTGDTGHDKLGVGLAQIRAASTTPARPSPVLTLAETRRRFAEIAVISGSRSNARRSQTLSRLFAAATVEEQRFLARLALGELRQGALAMLVLDAVALAFDLPAATVRRAWMLRDDIAEVTTIAARTGRTGLDALGLALFRPVRPMLAQPASDISDALQRIDRPILEYKLDGARVQIHKDGGEVRIFSRQGNDVSAALPELVEQIRALPEQRMVLDGETLALTADGRPLPFQTTMRRFGRHGDDAELRARLPLTLFCFDCLARGDETLLECPTGERHAALGQAIPADWIVPRAAYSNDEQAERLLAGALAAGHEGLMAKDRDAPYMAGGRGGHWLKVKQAHTLDLVVLAAEWGSGRRRGWLSNLHLGARTDGGGFLMLGKTFKGLTDHLLAWQTEQLLAREIRRDDRGVHVRPELVVEIAFNELQQSRQYPAGLALRFARVKRYRGDKSPEDADHIDDVRALFARQVAYQPIVATDVTRP